MLLKTILTYGKCPEMSNTDKALNETFTVLTEKKYGWKLGARGWRRN